jgi:hypothetical protein
VVILMSSSTNKESYILDLETKKKEFDTLLTTYQQTKTTYLNLTRKFKITNNKAIRDPSNNLYSYKETSDTQEKCKDICVNDLECGAAVFNTTTKSCAIYKTYTNIIDSSGNYAITPDTEAILSDISSTENDLKSQNTDLISKIDTLLQLLKDPQYKPFRDEQSEENQQFLLDLKTQKGILENDRRQLKFLIGDIFNLSEEIKETKISSDKNFYIQIVLSVITIILIFVAIYYLWPSSSSSSSPSSTTLTNQFMPISGMKPNNGLM